MKVAVALNCITGQLRTYINLQLFEGLKDDEFREIFVKWDRSQQKWSHLLSTSEEGPMEIDRMQYEQGKGKKRKDGQKGKGKKGSGKYGNSMGSNGKISTWSISTWGTGKGRKGDSKGKGHGAQEEKGKSKGQSEERRCYKCNGVVHLAKGRTSNVRQVEEIIGLDNSTSYRSSSSQQSSSPPSSTSPTFFAGLDTSSGQDCWGASGSTWISNLPMFDMKEANDQFSSEDSNVRVFHYYMGDADEGADHMVRAVIEEINEDPGEEEEEEEDEEDEEHDEPVTVIFDSGQTLLSFQRHGQVLSQGQGEHR